MTRIVALGVVVGFALLASGCGPLRGGDGISSGSASRVITDNDRNLAMMSIHAHARWPDRNFDGVDFMRFKDAIRILDDDAGQGAHSRVRRAVAKLLAYSWGGVDYRTAGIEDLLEGNPDAGRPPVDFAALKSEVEAASASTGIPLPPPPDKLLAFQAVIANSPRLAALTGNCLWQVKFDVASIECPSLPIHWTYELWVPRRMEDVARSFDPQKWAESSTIFASSYLVDAPSCCPGTSTLDCTYPAAPGSKDPQEGNPYAAAQAYPKTTFFEYFCFGKNCPACQGSPSCEVAFKNLLCVDTAYDRCVPLQCLTCRADRYDVYYKLAKYLFGEINGNENGNAIKKDSGRIWVRRPTTTEQQALPPGDWSYVHVSKTLEFKSSGLSVAVCKALQTTYADELKGQIAEQACYPIPKECWLATCP